MIPHIACNLSKEQKMAFQSRRKCISRKRKGKKNVTKAKRAEHQSNTTGDMDCSRHPTRKLAKIKQQSTKLEGTENHPLFDVFNQEQRRITIAMLFQECHNADPDERNWHGRHGIATQIKNSLNIPSGTCVKSVLREYLYCKLHCKKYTGESEGRCGRPAEIALDSEEARIIADNIERGMSMGLVWIVVNEHRREENLPSLTLSAVQGCIGRMNAVKVPIQKRPQGSYKPSSKCCRARYLWSLQLSVVTNLICSELAVEEYCKEYRLKFDKADNFKPAYLDVNQLNLIVWTDIAWFDETHRKVCPGTAGDDSVAILASKKHIYRVPKTNGKLDANGKLDDINVSQSYVKYADEGRFCFGVTVDEILLDGERYLDGKRLPLFDYTGTTILSPKDYDEQLQKEILRVETLKNGGQWIMCIRKNQKHEIYNDDPVKILPKIGNATTQLLHMNNIYVIKDLVEMSDVMIEDVQNIPTARIRNWRDLAINAMIGRLVEESDRPSKEDFRRSPNPYLSRYGEQKWKEVIKSCIHMRRYTDVRDLIDHITKVTKDAGKRYFYHDALSLMTCKGSIEYMRATNVLDMWIRPQLGLFEDYEDLKSYYGRVVGNSPELMPLDKSLNKDTHESVNQHYIITNDLAKDDPCRFGLSTPREVAHSYKRIWHPETGVAPLS